MMFGRRRAEYLKGKIAFARTDVYKSRNVHRLVPHETGEIQDGREWMFECVNFKPENS